MCSRDKFLFLIPVLVLGMINFNSAFQMEEERINIKSILDIFLDIGNKIRIQPGGNSPSKGLDCPLCDSSVFSYCSEKLLHDACCCLNPFEHKLPYQCKFADCGFLHANSCREHKLITACCCNNLHMRGN